MALSILDGNQSATTLSTILTSGQHITAHTVVSLGTQAITDMRGAVSGSVVSISNFPATQPVSIASVTVGNSVTIGSLPAISGTVTVGNSIAIESGNISIEEAFGEGSFMPISGTVTIGSALPAGTNTIGVVTIGNIRRDTDGALSRLSTEAGSNYLNTVLKPGNSQIGSVTASISGTVPVSISSVTVGNSVTIGSLPAISGTVTANLNYVEGGFFGAYDSGSGTSINQNLVAVRGIDAALWLQDGGGNVPAYLSDPLPAGTNRIGVVTIGAGTVTIGAGTAQIGSVTASISGTVPVSISSVTVGNSVTIGSLPAISGTVTAVNHQGTSVTTSNFTSTTASTTLASANASREVLTIFNEGAGNLHICAGATCTTIAYQVRLSAGDYYEVPLNQTSLTHSAVFATAGTARVTEIS